MAQAAKQQKRSYNAVQRDDVLGQPPAKKLVLDAAAATPRDRLLKSPSQSRASRIQAGASSQLHQPQKRTISSSYESKLAKERAIRQQQAQNNDQTDTQRKLEDLRQWQRHHRMRFPNYVFYFESIPDDVRAKLVKQIVSLGAVCGHHGPIVPRGFVSSRRTAG